MLKETLRRDRREGADILTKVEKSLEIKIPSKRVLEMLTFDRYLEALDACESVKGTSRVHTPKDKHRSCD